MTFDFETAKCPFCKEVLTKSVINSRDPEYYGWNECCNKESCSVDKEGWSKYIIFIDGIEWIQRITIGNYYIVNASIEPTTDLYNLEGCILFNKITVPKMKIDPCLGEEKIYEALKTFLIFS